MNSFPPPNPPNPPAPPSGTTPLKSVHGLGQGLWITMIVFGAIAAIGALFHSNYSQIVSEVENGTASLDDYNDAVSKVNAIAGLEAIVGIAIFVLLIIWLYRMTVNARSVGAPLRFSNGMTIGSFFIPVANAIIPAMILEDVRQSLASRGLLASSSKTQLRLWWWLYVVGALMSRAGNGQTSTATTIESVQNGNSMALAAQGMLVVAMVFGVITIRQMSKATQLSA